MEWSILPRDEIWIKNISWEKLKEAYKFPTEVNTIESYSRGVVVGNFHISPLERTDHSLYIYIIIMVKMFAFWDPFFLIYTNFFERTYTTEPLKTNLN